MKPLPQIMRDHVQLLIQEYKDKHGSTEILDQAISNGISFEDIRTLIIEPRKRVTG